MTEEVKQDFNIFECGKNPLYQLDVTYERAFMSTPQDKYYTRMLENLVQMNNLNGETLSNEKLRQAVNDIREETDAEHERNIKKITFDASFQYPMKKKDVLTINGSI